MLDLRGLLRAAEVLYPRPVGGRGRLYLVRRAYSDAGRRGDVTVTSTGVDGSCGGVTCVRVGGELLLGGGALGPAAGLPVPV